tara:strand:- start:241 stop:765 length:525 start_codon:yes stop_codon:yes gene_type:complete
MNQSQALNIINVFLTKLNNNRKPDKSNGLTIAGEEYKFTNLNKVEYVTPYIEQHMKEPALVPAFEYECGKLIHYPSYFLIELNDNLQKSVFEQLLWTCSFMVDETAQKILLILKIYVVDKGKIHRDRRIVGEFNYLYEHSNKEWTESSKASDGISRSFIIGHEQPNSAFNPFDI